jgi:hypothetical protein
MGQKTTRQQLAAMKADTAEHLAKVRECVQAAENIEGLEHLAGHMAQLETFVVLSLRILARTKASVVLHEMQALQVAARIEGFRSAGSFVEVAGHG